MAVPAQYDFIGDGTTRIFPIASRIFSHEYLKLEVNEEEILDTTTYDIINNSIVFVVAPLLSHVILVRVAESIEDIADLDKTSATIIVADNIESVITVADNITDVNAVAENIAEVVTVATDIASVVVVAPEIDSVIAVADALDEGTIAKLVYSDPTLIVGANRVMNIIYLVQADYDLIVTPDPATLYVITD